MVELFENSGGPDQTSRSAASDLGLHCLPVNLLEVSSPQCIVFAPCKRTPSAYFKLKLIVLGFNDTSTMVGHFVSSPREREKRDRRDSRGDEKEGRERKRNESEETEKITFPLYPYLLQG